MDLVTSIIQKQEALKSFRSPWENMWQECTDYVNPNRGDFSTEQYRGSQHRVDKIYDTTAPLANEQLASGLHSFLTSPSAKWFALKTFDDDVNRQLEVKNWLDKTTTILYDRVFQSPMSNFLSQSHELYLDLGSFGTGVMMVQDIPGSGITFRTYHLADCFIQENDKGHVDTLYRRYKRTGKQLIERFGEAVPEKVREMSYKDPYKEFEVIHAVEPSETYGDPSQKKATNKNFKSCYVLVEEKALLEEGGFDEFPYMVPRWQKVAGEIYGRSPSMTSLPDIKMVNAMMKTIIKGAQKMVDPPLLVPDDGFVLPVRTVPGGLNFYRAGQQEKIEPLETRGRPDIGFDLLQNRREHILAAFHVDWLKMPEQKTGRMTATEVVARQEEKMRLMGPMVGRLQVEFLGPLIERAFSIMTRKNLIPPAPQVIQDMDLKIEYTSPMARAQKSGQLMSVSRLFESMVPLFQAKPELLDNMNTDETFRYFHHLLDAPPQILNTEEDVSEVRQERQEQQQAMMEAEQLQSQSQSAKSMAEAQKLNKEV